MSAEVGEMVQQYLRRFGYDGLFSDDCGCRHDDLFPCGNVSEHCEAGYLQADGQSIGPKRPPAGCRKAHEGDER
jgi:hypothetical protein